jgi:DNA-binding MarR family transcriptional regulator
MGILPWSNKDNSVDTNSSVDITESGARIAAKYDAVTPELRILTELNQRQSSMSISDLASATGMSTGQTKNIINNLVKKRQVMILQ